MPQKQIVVDAREFIRGKKTGIGCFLEGLIDALTETDLDIRIIMASFYSEAFTAKLRSKKNVIIKEIPASFLSSEKALSELTKKGADLFISPYRKLPIFGAHCKSVNTIHDVLDLTHPFYRNRTKAILDIFRLKRALKKADLTWYDSSWSKDETKKLAGFTGRTPRVRYLGIDEKFVRDRMENEREILKKYDLQPGYILVIGNGLPHKNLGVLLRISDNMSRRLVFVGVSERNQIYWKRRYPEAKAVWVKYVEEEDLPMIIRGAFCLAQPSTAEGYGYPPLEAMACGVPPVVSNIPVLIETTGGNALSANPENPKEWLESFEALEDKDTYRTQVENGLKWVEPFRGRRGWGRHIADIEEILLTR
ncbi:MAG: glycosyltransferase family 4 protein [Deltaproteobacteria bacterium]|nr:glycosyltransferase family 4 protein [Deltaproteobacteria bacterium]MBL7217712.1 glycosyltransferase family 4 protein [Desulfobacteraceae bacterium]